MPRARRTVEIIEAVGVGQASLPARLQALSAGPSFQSRQAGRPATAQTPAKNLKPKTQTRAPNRPRYPPILKLELTWNTALTIAKAMKPTKMKTAISTPLAITFVNMFS
jgi:hypothetical protein